MSVITDRRNPAATQWRERANERPFLAIWHVLPWPIDKVAGQSGHCFGDRQRDGPCVQPAVGALSWTGKTGLVGAVQYRCLPIDRTERKIDGMDAMRMNAAGQVENSKFVAMRGVHKSFGSVRAVSDVTIEIVPGEIHAILGENGAGKSTLMGILSGSMQPDEGMIELDGKAVVFPSRKQGALAGIGIVQQHYGLVEDLDGIDNFLLGHPRSTFWLRRENAAATLKKTAEANGLSIDPHRKVSDLAVGERQSLEIVIALATGARLLIMDEPTAALGSSEIDTLTRVLRGLADAGKSVIYISHKLEEVMLLADRVTVMRGGKVAERFTRGEFDADDLTAAMIGGLPERPEFIPCARGESVASLENVLASGTTSLSSLHGITVDVFAGEVLGIAGVSGNGQEALAEVLAGLTAPSSGTLLRKNEIVAFIPEDRAKYGLAMNLTVTDNALLHRHHGLMGRIRTDKKGVSLLVSNLVNEADIRGASHNRAVAKLSGGNQQKLVVARELDRDPCLVVAHNPYRGLDVGATQAVRSRLLEARDDGAGVVLISPDLQDLFGICDRIAVISNGRFTGEVDPVTTSPEQIGAMMGGVDK